MAHRAAPPRSLRLYVLLVSGLAMLALTWARSLPPVPRPFASVWWTALVLTALAAAAGALPFTLSPKLKVHVATVPQFAALLLFPTAIAAAVGLGGTLGYQAVLVARGRRSVFDTLFNVSQTTLQLVAGGALFQLLVARLGESSANVLLAALAAALGMYAVNVVAVYGAAGLDLGRDPLALWGTLVARDGPQQAVQFVFGFAAALVATYPIFGLAAILSLAAAYYAMHLRMRVRAETCSSVEAMADAVDARVFGAPGHSRRVAEIAEQLARQLGLRPDAIALVRQAARVHDLGLIGIADELLQRPGPLTTAEHGIVQSHVTIGVALLERFPDYERCRLIVGAHHERPDGAGYPEGRAGTAVGKLAAIVAVADAFEALTHDRPYRSALTVDAALAVLRSGRGAQWDAQVADAALALFAPAGAGATTSVALVGAH